MKQNIDKAAREYRVKKTLAVGAADNQSFLCPFKAFEDAFKAGEEFCRTLPLAERLRPEEIKKIRGLYNGETFGELDFLEIISCRRIFENLFGKEMFREGKT